MNTIPDLKLSDFLRSLDEEEKWRPINGYPGYYVSSWGNIKSRERQLKPILSNKYYVVSLSKKGTSKNFRVHKLVASEFLGPPPFDEALVAHNDGNTSNNKVSNLRWASALENMADRVRHNTRPAGSSVFGSKLTEQSIPVIRERIRKGERYPSIAQDYNVSISTISLIKKNKTWKHTHGAAWRT